MIWHKQATFYLLACVLLSSCASIDDRGAVALTPSQQGIEKGCSGEAASLDTSFVAGNISNCRFVNARRVDINIAPEDEPINCSAWYAFRLTPKQTGSVTVNLDYDICGHRYHPKTSIDGITWTDLPENAVIVEEADGQKRATITISLQDKPLFVAAQEIIGPAAYQSWIDNLAKKDFVTQTELGKSAQGRSVPVFTIKAKGIAPSKQILLVGRQHPPEVTGAYGLFAFTELLVSDDPLAREFRQKYEVIIVPMLNPDGVVHGYWRHNTGGKDLNRDWGPFTQPETRLMQKLLADIETNPDRELQLMLDFHSTWNDVFYSIPDKDPTKPAFFTRDWLARLQQRMPEYNVNRDSNHQPDSPTSKAYSYATYGVPAVTFELGDATDRAQIKRIGHEAALAMIETFLDSDE